MRPLLCALTALPLFAQLPTCDVPRWTVCDLVFDLQPSEDASRATLTAEMRSPAFTTIPIRAFADGQRLILRVSPIEAGAWDYRLTSSLPRLDGQIGHFTATPSDAPGFVHTINLHHFQTADLQPHLWMSAPIEEFASMSREIFDEALGDRITDKFNHIRVTIDSATNLNEAAARIQAINQRGLIVDIVLADVPATPGPRDRYLTEIVSRFAPFNITWAGIPAFEREPNGSALARATGAQLAQLDPYHHPITTQADFSSSPFAETGWQSIISYGTPDPNVGAVEHQFYQFPALNTATRTRQQLWQATMNGQYPANGDGPEFAIWFDFLSQSRYWELEPYFDLDGARAIALTGVEYLVYVDKPGPIEMTVEDHGYDVLWLNPETGERVEGKKYKGKRFVGEAPDPEHDWVLRVSREGEKEHLFKTYKFESRKPPVQEIETSATKTPFEIEDPSGPFSLRATPFYSLKITKPSRATRDLLVLWTADLPVMGDGPHVVGTGTKGTMQLPAEYKDARLPSFLSVRVQILNAYGKAYAIDRAFRLSQ